MLIDHSATVLSDPGVQRDSPQPLYRNVKCDYSYGYIRFHRFVTVTLSMDPFYGTDPIVCFQEAFTYMQVELAVRLARCQSAGGTFLERPASKS
jgi:hypothetical protein